MKIISPAELMEYLQSNPGAALVDVRTPVEYEAVHLKGARSMPLDEITRRAVEDAFGSGKPVCLVCKSGARATKACEKLEKQGLTELVVVEGGTNACIEAGLPLVRGRETISLERQVRIAVGVLNLTAAILALAVHPAFAGLCAAFGAGLLFAGLTDWCGMGLMIARMPWNRTRNP